MERSSASDLRDELGIRNFRLGGGTVGRIYNIAYAKAMLQAAPSS